MTVNFAWANEGPVACVFFVKAAIVADPGSFVFDGFDFAVFVFAGSDTEDFVSEHPDNRFSGTFGASAFCFIRFQEPNARLETEGFVGESTHWAYVDHVAREIVVDGVFDVRRDFGVFATVQYAMNARICELIGYSHTTVA
jgi:hypothetical protein